MGIETATLTIEHNGVIARAMLSIGDDCSALVCTMRAELLADEQCRRLFEALSERAGRVFIERAAQIAGCGVTMIKIYNDDDDEGTTH